MTLETIEPDHNARRLIVAAVDHALEAADAKGVIPTPLDDVLGAAGVGKVFQVSELPPELVARRPSAFKKLLGALWGQERAVFIDDTQHAPRVRFTKGHELAHRVIPWHEALYFDDQVTLFESTREAAEAEANFGSAHSIFQGAPFFDSAYGGVASMDVPLGLAAQFGASLHATILYYTAHHPEQVALLVLGQYPQGGGFLPVFKQVRSRSFGEQFSTLPSQIDVRDDEGTLFGGIVREAMVSSRVPQTRVVLTDRNRERRPFVAEAFFNQRSVFLLLSRLRAADRVARRARRQALIVPAA